MSIMFGMRLGNAILDAVGIDDGNVTAVTLEASCDGVAKMKIERLLHDNDAERIEDRLRRESLEYKLVPIEKPGE